MGLNVRVIWLRRSGSTVKINHLNDDKSISKTNNPYVSSSPKGI